MKKELLKAMAIILIVLLGSGSLVLYLNSQQPYELKNYRSFYESTSIFSLSQSEKDSINKVLKAKSFENEDYFGFSSFSRSSNLYFANSVVELSYTLNSTETLDSLKSKLDTLENMNLQSLDMLNLLYYINICNKLDIRYDEKDVLSCLYKYYDSNANLFFMDSANDDIGIKLIITSLCYEAIPSILTNNDYDILSGVKNAYNSYVFSTSDDIALYNSGGDILYCYSVLGLINNDILEQHRSWFEYWKAKYEAIPINNIGAALDYSTYFDIASIFENSYSNQKLYDYYKTLSESDITEDIDYLMLNNTIINAKIYDNTVFNIALIQKLNDAIENQPLIETNIDILETSYGVLLSNGTDYTYDRDKLQNYIYQNYNDINGMDNALDIVTNLYYNLIIDKVNNNGSISTNSTYIQELLDKVLRKITFKENLAGDVLAARRAYEIVANLQIMPELHEVDVAISFAQRNKIKNGVALALESNEVVNSVFIADLFILNNGLNLELLDETLLLETYNKLTSNGGTKVALGEEYKADIYATYMFFECLITDIDYTRQEERLEYVNSLLTDSTDLATILYGYRISKIGLGGGISDIKQQYLKELWQ